MKTFNKNLLWVSIAALALTGCGSSSDSTSDSGDDHDHEHESSVLVSQSGNATLSLLEDGELEALTGTTAAVNPSFVLSETGAYAAVLSGTTVRFVHGLHDEDEEEEEDHDEEEHEHEEEAHLLDHSETGSQVITTGGHFAILNETTGTTTFIEYDELENDTPATEDTSALSLTETYPALVIDEEHELQMVFAGGNAAFYEAGEAVVGASFACATPTSHGQTDALVIVSCGVTGVIAVVIEEESGEHTFDDSLLSLDGTASNYIWQAQGHVIVGFAPETTNYAIVELDESGATPSIVVVEGSDSDSVDLSRNICDIKLDSEEQDVLVLLAGDATNTGDKLVVLSHEGEALVNVTLNSSTNTSCDNLVMASASKNAVVVDNIAQKAYDIDAHDSDDYHVHDTYELQVGDIANVVIFHEKDEDADHDHDH